MNIKIGNVLEWESLQKQLRWAAEEHLRAAGWKHTSSTPGCYWMWE